MNHLHHSTSRSRPIPASRFWAVVVLAVTTTVLSGCHSPGAVNLLKTDAVRFERVPSRVVDLPEPSIWSEKDDLVVSGNAHRRPMVSGILAGHVDVTVLSKDGEELECIRASMSPPWIPSSGPRHSYYAASHYTARSITRPPEGAIVRVAYRGGDHSDCLNAVKRGQGK